MLERRTSKYPSNPDLPLHRIHPNLNVTLIKGGYSQYAVPDECWIYGDRNVLPDESENPMENAKNELIPHILEVKQRFQIDLSFNVWEQTPEFAVSPDNKHIHRLRSVAAEKKGELYPIACSMGSNDIAYVAQKLGICTVSRGVQTENCNVHSYNENVPVKNLVTGVNDLIYFLSEET